MTGPDGAPLDASDGLEVRVHHPQWNSTFASTKVDPSTGRFDSVSLRLVSGQLPIRGQLWLPQ